MQPRANIVKIIANFSPWLAPIPSCYFVARSSIQHLGIPLIIGIVVGLVVETLGLSTVHLYLMLLQWNLRKKASDPKAPDILALSLVFFYLVITITLTVLLEVIPNFAIYAPVIFPLLALSGMFTLALTFQQEQKELAVQDAKLERSMKRQFRTDTEQGSVSNLANINNNLDVANEGRKRKKDTILERLECVISEHPEMGITELKKLLGVRSRSTVYSYIRELESVGRAKRTQTINS
jgi:large-conductance mechanosensitive channel